MKIDIVSDDQKRHISLSLGEMVLILLSGMASISIYAGMGQNEDLLASLEMNTLLWVTAITFVVMFTRVLLRILQIGIYDWRHPVKTASPEPKHPWMI